jgi:hypothetical protein
MTLSESEKRLWISLCIYGAPTPQGGDRACIDPTVRHCTKAQLAERKVNFLIVLQRAKIALRPALEPETCE